ncbi:MAG: hypothetical protein JWL64_940 [Frankiales bacterium]|nr:hypothetical protein [Frankiales bacterium]
MPRPATLTDVDTAVAAPEEHRDGGRWTGARALLLRQAMPAVAFVVLSTWLVIVGLHRLQTAQVGYDLGYFTQAVWLIQHGHEPYVTMSNRNVLGDHSYYLIYPLAWLLRPFPTSGGLIVVQSVVLAAGIWPLHSLCRRLALGAWPTGLVLAAYAVFPAMHNINTSDVHLDFLVVPGLLAAVAAAAGGRWRWYAVAIAYVLLNREDVPVTVACLGVLVAVTWSRRAGLATTGAAIFMLVIDRFVVIPAFSDGAGYPHNDQLPYGPHLVDNASHVLQHPVSVLGDLASQPNALFVLALLGPVAFLPLLEWRWLLPVLPVELLLLLSKRDMAHTIDAWYTASAIPFVFVALVFALQRLAPVLPRTGPLVMLGLAAVSGYLALSFDNPHRTAPNGVWATQSPRATAIRHLTELVPPGVSVASSPSIWTYIAERRTLVGYPVPADWVIIELDNAFLRDAPLPASCQVVAQEDLIVLARCV